jgi:hypothetical protein
MQEANAGRRIRMLSLGFLTLRARELNEMLQWLANLVAMVHTLVVTSVVLGGLAAITGVLRRYPRWELLYYVLLAGLIISELLFGRCFLTNWEKLLRNRHDPGSAYGGSFIGHYCPWLLPLVHAGLGHALIAAALLAALIWRWVDRHW